MIGALKYEWKRITTIRSTYWMSGMALVFTALVSLLIAVFVSASDVTDMDIPQVTTYAVTGGVSGPIIPVMAAPFYAVMGAMAIGHEYRYGTNKATLTAIPDRLAVLAAKLVVLLGWVVAVVVATLLTNLFITWLFLDQTNFSSTLVRPLALYGLYCLGFAVAGFSLAAVLRNMTGAIVAVLTYPLVVEPIIYGIAVAIGQSSSRGVGKLTNLMPAAAGRRMMFDPYDVFAGFGADLGLDVWGVGAAVFVYVIGVLIVLAAGSALFITRDA
jgi:ABC-2 type transport system permease protein